MPFTPLHFIKIQRCLELFNESALARPCITHNGEDGTPALFEIGDSLLQLGHLHFTANELCPHAGEAMGFCRIVLG